MSGKPKLKPGAPGYDQPGTDAPDVDERTATLEHLGIVAPAGDGAITPLGALLVERGDLSGQQLRDALGAQKSGGKRLGDPRRSCDGYRCDTRSNRVTKA